MRWLVLISVMLLWPFTAYSKDISVLGGEHSGFTRLVLNGTLPKDWSLGRVPDGYEFRVTDPNVAWGLNGSFKKIGRTRIRNLTDLGNGRLLISTDCLCHVEAFPLPEGRIVVDVLDGPSPDPMSPFEKRFDQPSLISPENFSQFAENDRMGLPLVFDMETSRPRLSDTSAKPALREGGNQDAEKNADRTRTEVDQSTSPTAESTPRKIRKTESNLLRQISRAAAQGLLDADTSTLEADIAATEHKPTNPEQEEANIPLPSPAADADRKGHFSIETSVDRATRDRSAGGQSQSTRTNCIPDTFLAIADWGDPPSERTDFGRRRSALLDQLGKPDPSALLALARYDLYLTFGAEAIAALHHFPMENSQKELLIAMAQIMDSGRADSPEQFLDQLGCENAASLWATLAQRNLPENSNINAPAIVLAFSALPQHLRTHLGPALAGKFLKAGDIETAKKIRNATARNISIENSGLQVLSARLDLANGDNENAAGRLGHVVSRNDEFLPDALITRAEALLTDGRSVDSETISLLESIATENANSQDRLRIKSVALQALISAGRFEDAFALFPEFSDKSAEPDKINQNLRNLFFRKITQSARDDEFLRYVVSSNEHSSDLTGKVSNAIADRLLDLGFPALAERFAPTTSATSKIDDRVLLARIALKEDRPQSALKYLENIQSEDAVKLRAQAQELSGDFEGAARTYRQVSDEADATRVAWIGKQWEAIADHQSGTMRDIAQMLTTNRRPGKPGGDNTGDVGPKAFEANSSANGISEATPLRDAQQKINISQETRSTINRLLSEVSPNVLD